MFSYCNWDVDVFDGLFDVFDAKVDCEIPLSNNIREI